MTESGGEGVEGIVNGSHIHVGQRVLERLMREVGVGIRIGGRLLAGCADGGQDHQGHG